MILAVFGFFSLLNLSHSFFWIPRAQIIENIVWYQLWYKNVGRNIKWAEMKIYMNEWNIFFDKIRLKLPHAWHIGISKAGRIVSSAKTYIRWKHIDIGHIRPTISLCRLFYLAFYVIVILL